MGKQEEINTLFETIALMRKQLDERDADLAKQINAHFELSESQHNKARAQIGVLQRITNDNAAQIDALQRNHADHGTQLNNLWVALKDLIRSATEAKASIEGHDELMGRVVAMDEAVDALTDVTVPRIDAAVEHLENVIRVVGTRLEMQETAMGKRARREDMLDSAVSELDSRLAKIESAFAKPADPVKHAFSYPFTMSKAQAQRTAKAILEKSREIKWLPADANGNPIGVGDLVCEVETDRCYRVSEIDDGCVTCLTALSDRRPGIWIYDRAYIEARSFVVVEKAPPKETSGWLNHGLRSRWSC